MSIVVRKPRVLAVSEAERAFSDDVLAGLMAEPKRLPPKYFYDQFGSELFQRITTLPEYYPTRIEAGLLEAHAVDIAKLIPPDAAVVEFGAGSSEKTRILLRAAPHVSAYAPVDISGAFLAAEALRLQEEMPNLQVLPVEADFTRPFVLPAALGQRPRVGFFPGSTIGNFEPHEADTLLRHAAAMLGPGALFVVGVDLVKDPEVLTAAYNDTAGVTAAFNLNLLERINRELDGDFDLDRFEHDAFYNAAEGRIEIYIKSLADQIVTVAGRAIRFAAGERIHTEDSCKYTIGEFQRMAAHAGFRPSRHWTDADAMFSVHLLGAG